jgi:hypothetical protein
MTGIHFLREKIFPFAIPFRLAEGRILPSIQWAPGSVYLVLKWYKCQFKHNTVLYKAQEKLYLVFYNYI